MTSDIGNASNPFTDRSPVTGRYFTTAGILEAGRQFANYERYLSRAPQTAPEDRGVHKHRADILWALVGAASE